MRKPALPPSAFLLDMAGARLENTLSRSPQKKEKKTKSLLLSLSLSLSVTFAAAVATRDLHRHFAPYLPSTVQCSAGIYPR